MAEIPGARDRLQREAEAICASLRSLAGRLTPGQVPEFAVPGTPFMDTGTEPATYLHTIHHRVHARDARAGRDAYTPAIFARAARLLAADGWETTREVPQPRLPNWGVVTGLREGAQLSVSVSRRRDKVTYQGRTPALALYEHVPHRRPEPLVAPETPLPGNVLCAECDGLGRCALCEGRGWTLGGRPGWRPGPSDPGRLGLCPECFGRRLCPGCGGEGQYYAEASPSGGL